MAAFLLDSDAVIDYLNLWQPTVELINGLTQEGHMLFTCDLVLAEVYAGLPPYPGIRAEDFLSNLIFLQSSRRAAIRAGEWRYLYARRGLNLPNYDVLIAATALERDATLVTGNVRHYPMPELSLLTLPR